MNESVWLTGTDPHPMLEYLRNRGSARQFRLFAVACCGHYQHILPEGPLQLAFNMAERLADEFLSEAQVTRIVRELMTLKGATVALDAIGWALRQAVEYRVKQGTLRFYHWDAARTANWAEEAAFQLAVEHESVACWTAARVKAKAIQADLVREVFKPFRKVKPSSSWLTWNGETVPKLAQAIYDERAFNRLPILADALEDAGCGNADILSHCRQPGPHVRGCWVVDLLLGKK